MKRHRLVFEDKLTEREPGDFDKIVEQLNTHRYELNGVEWAAARVTVWLGNAPLKGVAVWTRRRGEEEQYVTTDQYARKWLTDRGCPYAMVEQLFKQMPEES